MFRSVLMLTFVLLVLTSAAKAAESLNEERIQPWSENRSYWQLLGEPVMLVGGSQEDNLFQLDNLEAHLDVLAAAGGNYIRNTMSSRDEGDLWPFAQRPDGKYDLREISPDYFAKFSELLRLTHERGIIVQIELWDRFDFAREPWKLSPYRPANNVNYTTKTGRLKNNYPNHPGTNENRFFFSVPDLDNNQELLAFQQSQVDELLRISLGFPNVLYCMDNETSGSEQWGAYWAKYIQHKAAERGVSVFVTEMWDDWNLESKRHRRTFDHPELYPFVDISQNNHNKGQKHWNRLQWARDYVGKHPRPVNCVKVYGSDRKQFGNDRDGLERFWRNVLGGCAAVRFHRPPHGLGLSETVQANLKSVRAIEKHAPWWTLTPHQELLSAREPNEAYVAADLGKNYVVYFPDGGSVELDLATHQGPLKLQWIELTTAKQQPESTVSGGKKVTLAAPAKGHWAVVLW